MMDNDSTRRNAHNKSTTYTIHGFKLRRQHDVTISDGRAKTVLYLDCVERIDKIDVRERRGESFDDTVRNKATELILSNREKILELARNGTYNDLTLEGFYFLCGTYIGNAQKWLRNARAYRENWSATLRDQIGYIKLTDANLLEQLEKAPALSASKNSHKEMTDKERQYRRFLGGVLGYAEQLELVPSGIAKAVAKENQTHESTIALKMLAKQSFSAKEFALMLNKTMGWKDPQIGRAILLRSLTGMAVETVCGLDLGDYRNYTFPTSNAEKIYWLNVTKEYTQSRRGEPVIIYALSSEFAYRRFPCTDVLNTIIRLQMHERKKALKPGQKDGPLFTGSDDLRLTPNELKSVEEQLIDTSICSPLNLPVGRGSKAGRFRGDFLRANARFYLRKMALLNDQEVDVVLGVKPRQTYASHYVDWAYPYVLAKLRVKMERWHSRFLISGNSAPSPAVYRAVMLSGTVQQDTDVLIRSAYGVAVKITEQ